MKASDIITIAREDYLDDTVASAYLWSDKSLLRKLTEAERQACNRANLIYDDTTTGYTRITLVEGQRSYPFSSKLTVIEKVIFDGNILEKTTEENLDSSTPSWRTDTGMLDKTVTYFIKGRKIIFSREPDATDAGEVVSLETYRLPDVDITSLSQEPEIPEENHRDLLWWVLHECYEKQDADTFNQEKEMKYLAMFESVFGPYVTAKVRQHQFESPNVLTFAPKSYRGNSTEEAESW